MTVHARKRHQTLIRLSVAAVILWALVLISGLFQPRVDNSHPLIGQPVLNNFAQIRPEASLIRFTMADDRYTLERTASGWAMQESGGFPIRRDRLAALASGLESLTYGERRTAAPEKLDQIGLGAPSESGAGVLIEVFDQAGTAQHAILTGRKGDYLYVRTPDETQTYRAHGTLPPFYNRRAWLDFEIIDIEASAIRSFRLTDSTGRTAYFARPTGGDARSFTTAPPYQALDVASRLALSTTALAISRFAPLDAKRQDSLTTPPLARHISETFDGLEVDLQAYREPDGLWVTLRAVEAGEGARRAQAINEKAEGWAFKLSSYDWQDFTPTIASLVVNPEPSPEAPDE